MVAILEQIKILEDDWRGLYKQSWTGLIIPEAFAHPAKYSRALIRYIYDHVIEEGWVEQGSFVVDPFGGVALGGLDAMLNGLNWYGCELEAKFHDLGNQNIALWNDRYSMMPKWGTARLLNGDSRKLASVLSEARIAVSSPPYSGTHVADGAAAMMAAQGNARMIPDGAKDGGARYGQTEGQLGAMKEGDLNLAISSPPYSESMNRAGGIDAAKSDHIGGPYSQMNRSDTRYGESEGQLGSMKEGSLECAITSPPFPQPYCLAPHERVLTDDLKWVPCGEILIGDRLVAFDEAVRPGLKTRRLAFATVTHSTPAVKECVRVTLEDGQEIDCSADHPWLTDRYAPNGGGCQRAWTKAEDMVGRYALRPLSPWKMVPSYQSGWVDGIADGEGSVSMHRDDTPGHESLTLQIAQKPGEVLDQIHRLVQAHGFDFRPTRHGRVNPTLGIAVKGGWPAILCFLGAFRPIRLIANFKRLPIDRLSVRTNALVRVKVVRVVPIAMQAVQSITTSTGTLIGEGYLMHNTSGGGINHRGLDRTDGRPNDPIGDRTYQSKGGDRSEGNLETMDDKGFAAAISSPPFEASLSSGELKPEDALRIARNQNEKWNQGRDEAGIQNQADNLMRKVAHNYGGGDNLGNQRGEDFWSASRIILEQLHSILTPGAHAVFVVKAFVRNKQIVDFPGQWAQLCEAVGFKLIHHHRALLTEEYGTQTTFHGEDKTLTIARKSFFRRLAESKGSPRIDWESVLCFEKA